MLMKGLWGQAVAITIISYMKRIAFMCLSFALASSLLFVSCAGSIADLTDFEEFLSFNEQCPASGSSIDRTVSLFVDYSTCVAEAKQSPFFIATHPSIVDCSPIYYSIKGSEIREETRDKQQVYGLLNNITQVNYADIKKAAEMISSANNQAVLITDGEYYLKNNTGSNPNNPYMADAIRAWLNKGYDIYFYCEPYKESGLYDKYRYYILFTDDDLDDNINDRFSRSSSAESNGVTVFHLSNGHNKLSKSKTYPDINPAVSPSDFRSATSGVDIQEYYSKWEDMIKYLSTGDLSQDYILRGLVLDNSKSDSYIIKSIKPVVYQMYPEYEAYQTAKMLGEELPKAAPYKKLDGVFSIDEETFAATGEIILKLSSGFDGRDLSTKEPKLLRVDFVVVEAENNFSYNAEVNSAFKWASINRGHGENTSVYESISQVLQSPSFNPQNRETVLYTVYISTYSN